MAYCHWWGFCGVGWNSPCDIRDILDVGDCDEADCYCPNVIAVIQGDD